MLLSFINYFAGAILIKINSMKIFIIFSLILSSTLYAQVDSLRSQYEVIYSVKFLSDTLNKNSVREENLSLLIKDQQSLFRSTKKAYSDSIAMDIGKKAWDRPIDGRIILNMKNVPLVYFKSEVFYNDRQQIIYKDLMGTRLSYPLHDIIQWKIETETKVIESYLCKKATGKYNNRNYVAWFTQEVPIPDGPYVFKGLPGLILEVYDTRDYYHFSMQSITQTTKPMLPMKDVFATVYSNFLKARKNILDNPVGALSRQTGYNIKPEDALRINENIRRANNYID